MSGESLETLPVAGDDLIEEREGVHYINQIMLDTNNDETAELDEKFKKLVDSVIND